MLKNRKFNFSLVVALLLSIFSSSLWSSPLAKLEWKIFKTDHFRIHYTAEYEAWSLAAAHEMEASRAVLLQQQKRTLPEIVDVVVFDPLNDSNGFAIPYSKEPFMALFTTPPLSDSQISNSSSWPQLLALHEYAHLLHLAQPSRNKWRDTVANLYDLYDVVQGMTERWVAEGYATLLESKLTGRGRLYDVQVEMMLQQFAREGGWPTYDELSQVEGRYRLGNMAYLIGGRFLAWVEANYSEKQLDAVWTRMKGVKRRNFEDAFSGVFLQHPRLLYRRFVAEFTTKVMNAENRDAVAKYQLWFDADFDLNEPALSPDNKHIVMVERSNRSAGRVNLVVYETADNQKAKEEFDDKQKKLLAADPVDIADSTPDVFKRKEVYNLAQRNMAGLRHPRWMGDDAILFVASSTDSNGFNHQDLFKWKLSTDTVTQLTRGKNVRRFDIDIASGRVYAEINRYGYSSLVHFNITNLNNAVETQTIEPEALDKGYDFPRVNPVDNNTIAYLQRESNQPWRIKVRNLTTQKTSFIALPHEYQFLSYINWSRDGKALYYVAGKGETLKLYRYEFHEQKLFALTQGHVPVAWPMELPSKLSTTILFSSYRSTGPNLYSFQSSMGNWTRVFGISDQTDWAYLENVSPYPIKMPAATFSEDDSIGEYFDYNSKEGLWRQEKTMTLSGQYNSASVSLSEVGIKSGDLFNTFTWQLNAGADLFQGRAAGVSGYVNWQGWPIELHGSFHYVNLDYRNQGTQVALRETTLAGFNLGADYPYRLLDTYTGEVSANFQYNESKPDGQSVVKNTSISIGHKQTWWLDRQSWGLIQHSDIRWLSGQHEIDLLNNNADWTGQDYKFSLGGHVFGLQLTAEIDQMERMDINRQLISLGGSPSTLMAENMFSHWQFSPELPFGYDLGNKLKRQTLALSKKFGSNRLYYSKLTMDDNDILDIYGLRGQGKTDLFGNALSDLVLDYGVASLVTPNEEYSVQGWFGIRYQY